MSGLVSIERHILRERVGLVATVVVLLLAAVIPGTAEAVFRIEKDTPCVQHACRATVVTSVPAGARVDVDFEHAGLEVGFNPDATQTCPDGGSICTLRMQGGPLQAYGTVPIAVRTTTAGEVGYSQTKVEVVPDIPFYCNAALGHAGAALPALRRPGLRSKQIPVRLPGRGSADIRASTLVGGQRIRLAHAWKEDMSSPAGTTFQFVLDANGRRRATKALRSKRTLRILVEVRINTFNAAEQRIGRTFTVRPSALR